MNKKTSPTNGNNAPNLFIQKHQEKIIGVLSGFDRLRIRGTLRQLYCPKVMEAYLTACRVLHKDFGKLVLSISQAIKNKTTEIAEKYSRPIQFIASSHASKEDIARKIAKEDGVKEGLIAVLSAVEPCKSYKMVGNRQTKRLEIKLETRKCSHYYFYFEHPKFGFMHLRLQSWFPFQVNLCINGRHWLAKQLDAEGIAYQKKENTFLRIADLKRAQELLDMQLGTEWPKELGKILKEVHPLHRQICRPLGLQYYWSTSETEYATDVIFKEPGSLAKLYPTLVHHAMSSFSSQNVMRFLGRSIPVATGRGCCQFDGEIISDVKRRLEGVRVKHSVNGNSIKFYDKQGSVLRVETTIVRPGDFKTYRKPEGNPKAKERWLPLRRGFADLKRRSEISRRANGRYLQALGATSGTVPLFEWVKSSCKPIVREGKRYRALNPLGIEDGKLLELVNQGEFALNGFRNRDIRAVYFKGKADEKEMKRRMGWIGRRLRLLRAHGLIQKVSGTHRYVVSEKGRTTITALLAARKADVDQLTKIAA